MNERCKRIDNSTQINWETLKKVKLDLGVLLPEISNKVVLYSGYLVPSTQMLPRSRPTNFNL